VVFNDGGVHLYAQPSTAQAQAPLLPWNTSLTVDAYLPPDAAHKDQAGWCHVTTPSGQRGYVNSGYLDYDLPDPQAKLLKIRAHDTAEIIVKKAGYRFAHGRDARYYINVLVSVNKPGTLYNPDPHPEQTNHWKKTVAVKNETIWLPGQAFADSLTGVVGSGSITGGAWAALQQELGWAQVVVQHTISVLSQPVALVADAATNAAHYALTVGGRVMGPFVGAAAHEAAALVGGTMRAINAATSNPAALLHAMVGLATAPARLLTAIPGAFVGLLQEQGKALLGALLGTQVRDELGDTIGAILKDPLTFARNLATAVGVGFHGLLAHLGTHFLSDALGWLAGRSGLTIPTGVGLGELVLIVAQQVVGLGEAHLTDLLVKALVKRGTSEPQARTMVQRAEGVIGTLGTVLTHLPHSAGEAGHLVTQALGTLGATVRDVVQGWLLQKVVTAAIAKLVALCSPGVGLVLQAVQAIYGAIQTFLQYKEQLGALLGRLMGTFKGLATPSSGAVTAAGGAITGVLVGMIPPALNFIADFFGLGGLAAKVQGVIGAIRAKIDTMVSAIINRLVGLVQGIAGRIGGARGSTTGTLASGHAPPAPAHQDNPTHEAIAQAIVTKLEHIDGAPKDFAATRAEKEGEARPLKARYQPQLEKGINLSITFATRPDYAQEKEFLDFIVTIAPNTTRKSGQVTVAYAYTPGLATRIKLTNQAVRQAALAEVNTITSPTQVSPQLVDLAKSDPHILDRYTGRVGNDGYIQYVNKVPIGSDFDTPLMYLRRRASFKRGRAGEAGWIDAAIKGATKNNQTLKVQQSDGTYVERVPDIFIDSLSGIGYVGDVKDVIEQSFTKQLVDSYIIAKHRSPGETKSRKVIKADGTPLDNKVRRFVIVVRPSTDLSGPLRLAVDQRFDTVI